VAPGAARELIEEEVGSDRFSEQFVLDSDVWFLCACINKRFPHSLELRQLKPYTANSIDTGEVLYGWVDQFGNYIDHCNRSIHNDDDVVVRWVQIESTSSWLELLEEC
jgi:hypothetical protein